MFQPDESVPVPLKYIDVHRTTKTSVGDIKDVRINDWWDGSSNDPRELSEPWTGTTSFQLVQPPCKQAGHMFLSVRQKPVRQIASNKPEFRDGYG